MGGSARSEPKKVFSHAPILNRSVTDFLMSASLYICSYNETSAIACKVSILQFIVGPSDDIIESKVVTGPTGSRHGTLYRSYATDQ